MMFLSLLILLPASAGAELPTEPQGRIQGVVVNGTHGHVPIGDVVVVLRAGAEDALIPVAETQTDHYGKFNFDDVPVDPALVYLPGADHHDVHYPGNRVRLDPVNRIAHLTIVAFDAVEAPSPLIAQRHDIEINVRQDVLEVSETLVIVNRERATYVGEKVGEKPPVTLRLSIPPNFDRVTFHTEFYGRRFRIVDRQPVTDIPWPPGRRELKYTYRVPLEGSGGVFRRPIDVPCDGVRVRVRGKDAEQASCNLPLAKANLTSEPLVASTRQPLPAGHAIEVRIGSVPFPWMQYARWGSLCLLAVLALATSAVMRQRDTRSKLR